MRFAVLTVIFPEIKVFFSEFIQSLRNQSDQDFQLIIVNDKCCLSDFDLSGFQYSILPNSGSIAKNREILIHEAIEQKYEWIIFADADDWFESNRIEVIRGLIPYYDIIANEIVPFSGIHYSHTKFEKTLGKFCSIDLNFIRDKNLFGLSNTAFRTHFLENIDIPLEIIAVDWYLVTKAMQTGARSCFTAETKTYYRQWDKNIIGIDKVSEKEIKTGVKVKYLHYKNLAESDSWYTKDLPWLQNLFFNTENTNFDIYKNKVRKADCVTPFWWQNIKNYDNDKISFFEK